MYLPLYKHPLHSWLMFFMHGPSAIITNSLVCLNLPISGSQKHLSWSHFKWGVGELFVSSQTPLWGFKMVLTQKLYISITLSHLAVIDQPMLRCTFVVCLRMMSLQNIWVVTIFHWVCLRIYIIVINIKVFYLLGVKLTSWNPYILKYHIIQVMNMHGQI